jgi:hypothetical protein
VTGNLEKFWFFGGSKQGLKSNGHGYLTCVNLFLPSRAQWSLAARVSLRHRFDSYVRQQKNKTKKNQKSKHTLWLHIFFPTPLPSIAADAAPSTARPLLLPYVHPAAQPCVMHGHCFLSSAH